MKNKAPAWNLSFLYKNPEDPKIKKDLTEVEKSSLEFAKKYRTKINNNLRADQLQRILQEYESIFTKALKLLHYASLVFAADTTKIHFYQNMSSKYLDIRSTLLFFDVRLSKLEDTKLKRLALSDKLTNYKHYLEKQLEYKPHILNEVSEKIFNDKSQTSANAFNNLFEQTLSEKKFTLKDGGRTKLLSESEMLNLLHSPKAAVRKAAAAGFTQGLKEEASFLTFTFNAIAKDKAINDKWHKFSTPEQARHMDNEVTQAIVDTMSQVISDNNKVVADFYNFKKRLMKVKKLNHYDRYAPITDASKKYTFDEAKAIILKSFQKLSPEFATIAKKFFDEGWIDAEIRPNKRSGGFCDYITPDTHPVIFMNYHGDMGDVQTLAHELGHAINGYMMRKQTLINFDTPLTLAETASVFGEMLVFDELRTSITNPKDKLALFVGKIEGIFSTVFRQNSMYLFEKDYHALKQQKGELTTQEFSELWLKRQKQMFGKSVELTDDYGYWWSYIPHFLHTPFYVYAYAFGELLVLALYAKYKKEGKGFVAKYMKLMEAGASDSPKNLLQPLGINLEDKKFWQEGIDIIKELVKEAKQIK